MKYITILLFLVLAISVEAQQQTPTYDVIAKDGKTVLVENDGKNTREVPITSADLQKQYSDSDTQLKALIARRAQVAELLRLDEEIAALNGQKDFIADLFKKAQAVEKTLAESSKPAENGKQ